jgi:hypothetical protein
MKRTGSASCLLRPKHSLSADDLQRLARDPPTATVLTVNKLPSYNADRLYIQSELQVHSSLHTLSEVTSQITPSIILYLLWDVDSHPTPRTFADGLLSESVRQCLEARGEVIDTEEIEQARCNPRLSPYSPRRPSCELNTLISPSCDEYESNEQALRIYVVVDKVSRAADIGELPNFQDLTTASFEEGFPVQYQHMQNETSNESFDNQSEINTELQRQSAQHNNELKSAESLARAVASSRFLRNRIDGISIGITSEPRAAPGLEAVMDAVSRSAKERRSAQSVEHNNTIRNDESLQCLQRRSPERSPISIVVCKSHDLEWTDAHSHHHHGSNTQLLQSRVTCEWNGKGDYNTFSDRAMRDWRRVWSEENESLNGASKKKVPRLSRKSSEADDELDEPISTFMVAVFVIGVAWYVWSCYGEYFYSLGFCSLPNQ